MLDSSTAITTNRCCLDRRHGARQRDKTQVNFLMLEDELQVQYGYECMECMDTSMDAG